MDGGLSVEQHIDAVDAFARTLFIRSRESPSISDAVRQLHIALRHLRVEAADPDSSLRSDSHIYQLRDLVDECGASLRQLEGALDDGRRGDQLAGAVRRLRDRIDDFLDAIQLQSRATIAPVNENQVGLEGIKDKVDAVATRIFARREGTFSDDEDSLWREFKTELENEGFSADVLKRHKEVLRAYIRGLVSMSSDTGGSLPTVRGLLESGTEASTSPKEMYPAVENEKFAPSMKMARRMPNEGPPPLPPKEPLSELSSSPQPRQSFSSDRSSPRLSQADSLALISTRDLVNMDSLNQGMANMQLTPQGYHQQQYVPPQIAGQRYLPSPQLAGHLTAPPESGDIAGSPSSLVLGSSPLVAPLSHHDMSNSQAPYGQSPRTSHFRLAPDRYGNEIPMDAQWTRINRERVSVEVLERAGVRYEARPTYVAILGRLSREQIEDFIRQTIDCRAARELRKSNQPQRHHERADSKSSHDDDDEDSDQWNGSDTTDYDDDKTSDKGNKGYPYIVSPPEKEKGSPSSTVPPKSILKNKNENRVHFGPSPYETEKTPRSVKDDLDWDRERDRDRDRRNRRRRVSNRNDRNDRYYSERDRHGNYSSGRDRERSSRYYHDDRERDYYSSRRPQNRDHERSDREFERRSKKKVWGETLGAVGLGGAAVSLLGVLAEAV